MKILEKITVGQTVVAIGRHEGKTDLAQRNFSAEELALLNGLSPRKQSEWVASRDLLFAIGNFVERPQCLYDDLGKPYLLDVDRHISISHSDLWCAAMISDQPCGVDVQVYSDTVRRIADRFLTPEDLLAVQHAEEDLLYLHLLWGAKECLYKAYGKRKLGFRENLFISEINLAQEKALGEIIYEDIHLLYDIKFKLLSDVAWVYCVERGAVAADFSK
jgi:phosphopantetheinyl transferase (holo-ACP synthase)